MTFVRSCRGLLYAASMFGALVIGRPALAQSSSSAFGGSGSNNVGTPIDSGAGSPAALAGGGAMADFDTLMNLIQQTVDPDSWLAAGGTSSLLPYPAGVYIDPKGHMQRTQKASSLSSLRLNLGADAAATPANSLRHPWRCTSPLRTISLRRLDQALQETRERGLRTSSEIENLAGLSRIQYVCIDVANEDVLIAGPATLPTQGLQLRDIALVTSLIRSDTQPMGCSIEPGDAGILAAQEMLQDQSKVRQLARNPQMIVQQLQEKIGPHHVRIFGMPADVSTVVALIDADEHMKKLGFGTVATTKPIDSYFDYLDRQSTVANQSLVRWWFSFSDAPVHCNAQRDLFELPEQCVVVLSEQQWVTQLGRSPTGGQDDAADAFAKGLTARLGELREEHASYARLHAVFESALALQLVLDTSGQPSWRAWFPNICGAGETQDLSVSEPRSVEGLTTWHKLTNGTTVAVVSGGVEIDVRRRASQSDRLETSQSLVRSLIPTPAEVPSTAHGNWWWD